MVQVVQYQILMRETLEGASEALWGRVHSMIKDTSMAHTMVDITADTADTADTMDPVDIQRILDIIATVISTQLVSLR